MGDFHIRVSFQEAEMFVSWSTDVRWAVLLVCTYFLSPWASLGTWERTSRQPEFSLFGKMVIKNG